MYTKKYQVTITATLEKIVEVYALDTDHAEIKAMIMSENGEIDLTADDLISLEAKVNLDN